MTAILGRFFKWVAAAVLVTLATGVAMIALAGGMKPLHGSVYWMFGIGVVMMLIFGHIRFAPFPRLQRAVAAKDWPTAARNLDMIRVMVSVNLAFGIVTIMVATLGRAFPSAAPSLCALGQAWSPARWARRGASRLRAAGGAPRRCRGVHGGPLLSGCALRPCGGGSLPANRVHCPLAPLTEPRAARAALRETPRITPSAPCRWRRSSACTLSSRTEGEGSRTMHG